MDDPFDKILDDEVDERPAAPRFPLVPCLVSILFSSSGLAAVACNVRWGASTPPDRTDVFEAAWLYVHTLLVFLWLVIWPALALQRRGSRSTGSPEARRAVLGWELAALLVGVVPAVGLAAFLSNLTLRLAWPMLALQASLALLAFGTLTFSAGTPWETLAAGLLAAIALAAPLMVYFWAEFFGAAFDGWFMLIPAMAVAHAGRSVAPGALFWWLAGVCAATGLALWVASLKLQQES